MLTTVESVRLQGGDAAAEYSDEQIQIIIDGISDLAKQVLHRDITVNEYEEYHSGTGDHVLLLRQYPIVAVERVCIDPTGAFGQADAAFSPANDLVQGVDYAVMAGQAGIGSSGALRRIGARWPRPIQYTPGRVAPQPGGNNGNILVKYTAGYAVVPPGLVYAINQAVLKALANVGLGGEAQSKSYEDASISYVSASDLVSVFGSIDQVLGQFKSFPV